MKTGGSPRQVNTSHGVLLRAGGFQQSYRSPYKSLAVPGGKLPRVLFRGEFNKTNIFAKPCFQGICRYLKQIFYKTMVSVYLLVHQKQIFDKVFSLFSCSTKNICFGKQLVSVNSPLPEFGHHYCRNMRMNGRTSFVNAPLPWPRGLRIHTTSN